MKTDRAYLLQILENIRRIEENNVPELKAAVDAMLNSAPEA